MNEAIQVESKLRKWVTDLEKIGSDDSAHTGELDKEVTVLQLQITAMTVALTIIFMPRVKCDDRPRGSAPHIFAPRQDNYLH